MRKIVRGRAEVGEDRVLRLPVPSDVPAGSVEVTVVLEETGVERRTASPETPTGSVDEFLVERRRDEERRERALALAAWGSDELADVIQALAAFYAPYYPTPQERRAAVDAGFGMLRGLGVSTEELRAERRADDARRDKALGL